MILHTTCMRAICAKDAIQLLEKAVDAKCPTCRRPLRNLPVDVDQKLLLARPTPNDQYWMDQVDFQCTACSRHFKAGPARTHHQNCWSFRGHQPPPHLPQRDQGPLERRELASNPPTPEWARHHRPTRNRGRDRLLINSLNGRQVASRFAVRNNTIASVKAHIERLTGVPAPSIRTFKFSHEELPDTALVGDVAQPVQGYTHQKG